MGWLRRDRGFMKSLTLVKVFSRKVFQIKGREVHKFSPENYEELTKLDRFDLLNCLSAVDLHKELNKSRGALKCAMQMRSDIIELLLFSTDNEQFQNPLKTLEVNIVNWLSIAVAADNLDLKRITFELSSGEVLENIAREERVHPLKNLSDFKKRLHNDRRCFAFFHRSLPAKPLVFIHIVLTLRLATSLSMIDLSQTAVNPSHAMFYSVNSPYPSLKGIELAARLIKEVTTEIQLSFPSVLTFSTLSPMPGFIPWFQKLDLDGSLRQILPSSLVSNLENEYREYLISKPGANVLSDKQDSISWFSRIIADPTTLPSWPLDQTVANICKPLVMYLGAYFIVNVKAKKSLPFPLDPVARFHLRNGAEFHSLNWLGNPSPSGLASSAGLMVNYLYLPESGVDMDKDSEVVIRHSQSIKGILNV